MLKMLNWNADLFASCNFFQSYPGYGVHEVIIETPVHNRHLGDLQEDELSLVLRSFEDRITALAEDSYLRYVQISEITGGRRGGHLLNIPIFS